MSVELEAEYQKWKGVVERYPQVYMGISNDLAVIPKDIRERLMVEVPGLGGTEETPQSTLAKKISSALDKRDIALEIMKSSPCYYDKARNWWLWDSKEFRWIRVDETDILNSVEDATDVNTINSKNKSEMIEALRQASRRNKPKDIKNTWIQFKDTIVDVTTGEKIKASPEYFVTNPIPWPLHPDHFLETPVMDKIFTDWVGEENIKKLYEILSYCLIPDYPLHRIFTLIGSGMNGKSKFLDLLSKFIGEDNCVSTELEDLIKQRFEKTKLHRKLVCLMGETNFNEMANTSMLKKLSGGDLIGFEYKGKDHFDEKNYAKLLIATNNLPTTADKSIGFYRRWMIIDFPNQFSEKKDILADIPDEEYCALALKSTLLLKDLLKERTFHNEGSIEERMNNYESKSDFIGQFIKESTVENLDGYITKSDFKKIFEVWRKENRHREVSDISIGKAMKRAGIEGGKKYFHYLFDGKGGQAKVWEGITWKAD